MRDDWEKFNSATHCHVCEKPFALDDNREYAIERSIRGSLSQCSNRYARANKYMRLYDPSKPSSYLMYFDVNNLYGWAMCQLLPYADFQWIDDVTNFNVNVVLDSSTDYILEIDLEYPQYLHNDHADLPSVRRAINCKVNGRTNFLQYYIINSVTSYIIVICSSVLVTVFEFQKFPRL